MDHHNSKFLEKERPAEMMNRISEKIKDYGQYSFTDQQDCALKTFFDLAQEFEEQRDFYLICVLIPKVFFQFECKLYLINGEKHFEMVYLLICNHPDHGVCFEIIVF